MQVVEAEARVTAEGAVQEVEVGLGPRSYSIVIGSGLLPGVGTRLASLGFHGRAAVVTSERIGALYREPIVESLRAAGFHPTAVEFPDGEEQDRKSVV